MKRHPERSEEGRRPERSEGCLATLGRTKEMLLGTTKKDARQDNKKDAQQDKKGHLARQSKGTFLNTPKKQL